MTQTSRCPRCGATLPPGRAQCAACLVALGIDNASSSASDEAPSRARERRGPPPAPSELAADFPELEIGALLGEGGMGVVYRARHRQLERDVALKLLAPDLVDDPRFEERFLREARALAKLDHAGIVRVHDFGRKGARLYLVMEFVDGTNLRALIKAGRLTSREALAIVPQICEALQYAHDEGVVHRDIKPENVLIDAKGRVKLADFGLAKLVGVGEPQHTATGVALGTAHYAAPEQLARPREVDHRADIYSLGVVFYEMLTGELPVGRFEPPSKRVQIDVRLDEIVLRSLESAPERRYQHAVDVKTDVDDVVSDPRPAESPPRKLPPDKLARAHDEGIAIAQYAVAWIAIGVAFNLGAFAFCAASALLLLIALRFERRAAKREEVRWTRTRAAIAITLFPVGFALFFAGVVALTDNDTRLYDSGFVGLLDSHEHGLDPIQRFLVDSAGGAQLSYGRRDVLTDLDAPEFWRQRWFVLLGLAVWFVALSLPRWLRTGGTVQLEGVSVLRALLVACVPLWAILIGLRVSSNALLGSGSRVGLSSIDDRWESSLTAEDAATRARVALLGIGYQVHTELDVQIVLPDSAKVVASSPLRVRVAHADASDLFRRYRVTWRGFQRALPVVTTFVCTLHDGRTVVIPYLGKLRASNYPPSSAEWFAPVTALSTALRQD